MSSSHQSQRPTDTNGAIPIPPPQPSQRTSTRRNPSSSLPDPPTSSTNSTTTTNPTRPYPKELRMSHQTPPSSSSSTSANNRTQTTRTNHMTTTHHLPSSSSSTSTFSLDNSVLPHSHSFPSTHTNPQRSTSRQRPPTSLSSSSSSSSHTTNRSNHHHHHHRITTTNNHTNHNHHNTLQLNLRPTESLSSEQETATTADETQCLAPISSSEDHNETTSLTLTHTDEYPTITPVRKSRATRAFQDAARTAAAVNHPPSSTTTTTTTTPKNQSEEDATERDVTERMEDDSRTIRGLLESIPAHLQDPIRMETPTTRNHHHPHHHPHTHRGSLIGSGSTGSNGSISALGVSSSGSFRGVGGSSTTGSGGGGGRRGSQSMGRNGSVPRGGHSTSTSSSSALKRQQQQQQQQQQSQSKSQTTPQMTQQRSSQSTTQPQPRRVQPSQPSQPKPIQQPSQTKQQPSSNQPSKGRTTQRSHQQHPSQPSSSQHQHQRPRSKSSTTPTPTPDAATLRYGPSHPLTLQHSTPFLGDGGRRNDIGTTTVIGRTSRSLSVSVPPPPTAAPNTPEQNPEYLGTPPLSSPTGKGGRRTSVLEETTTTTTRVEGGRHGGTNNGRRRVYSASMNGASLSQTTELLYFLPSSSPSSSSIPLGAGVRYNDTVFLHAPAAEDKALGVRTIRSDTDENGFGGGKGNVVQEVGFYRSLCGRAEQWIVRCPPGVTDDNDDGGGGGYVQSNGRVLLQNALSGGVLSVVKRDADNDGYDDYHCYGTKDGYKSGDSGWALTLVSCYDALEGGWYDDIDPDDPKSRLGKETSGPTEREVFHPVLAHVPPLPDWSTARHGRGTNRPYLDRTYLEFPKRNETLSEGVFEDGCEKGKGGKGKGGMSTGVGLVGGFGGNVPLSKQPVEIQELILVEEVIGCLMGLEGTYLRRRPSATNTKVPGSFMSSSSTFTVPPNLDRNLTDLLNKILPTCDDYVAIDSFLSLRRVRYEFGRVAHALCGAMEELVEEYLRFVVTLDDGFRASATIGGGGRSGATGMTSLWGELQPTLRTVGVLKRTIEATEPLKGGELLNRLEEIKTVEYLGDERATTLLRFLLERASAPYMEMLGGWLEGGTIVKDLYGEFMVEESISPMLGEKDDDREWGWDDWYVLREEHVLRVMLGGRSGGGVAENLAEMVLTTGKYWNAIKYCYNRDERAVQPPTPGSPKDVRSLDSATPQALTYDMDDVELSRFIECRYKVASRTFLNITVRDYRLLDVLAFMKQYFLLDQGDFFVHFLDKAETELLKEVIYVSRGRVQNWMTMSVQMTGGDEAVVEPASGDFGTGTATTPSLSNKALIDVISSLKGDFATQSLVDHLDALHAASGGIDSYEPKTPSRHVYGGVGDKQLTGVECFMLDFHRVPFPLSLALSHHTVTNYQLLFRHLFFVKHVERSLVGTWLDHQTIKEFQTLRKDLGRTYCLRQRMLHFIQNFVYYMMFEVIEPNWLEMEAKILQRRDVEGREGRYGWAGARQDESRQRTVDDMLRVHNDFVRRTLRECLLTNRDLIRALTKMMTTCLLFSDQMKKFMKVTQIEEEQAEIATEQRQQRRSRKALLAAREKRLQRKQKQIDRLQRELRTDNYIHMVAKFEEVFDTHLSEFMALLTSDSGLSRSGGGRGHNRMHLANLCVRLDYNGYVTRSLAGRKKGNRGNGGGALVTRGTGGSVVGR